MIIDDTLEGVEEYRMMLTAARNLSSVIIATMIANLFWESYVGFAVAEIDDIRRETDVDSLEQR